jgi:hypothetical protein
MSRRRKEPTSTLRVFETLCQADDFRTGRQLQEETKLDSNRVSASLYHLKKYHAADFIEADGALWWFPTPQEDRRTRTVDERCPESKHRKPRRPRLTQPKKA